ncbi:BON domain-containing protein [Paraburkholderia sp. BR10923]|uniref:BON domain-containing protein n=1 Tax=Paraburkholderia TaxID=1822464 RepID=UPI0034CE6518
MKSFSLLKALTSIIALTIASSVCAQSSNPATETTATAPSDKGSNQTNRALARKVRGALTRTQGLNVSSISVRARGGAVVLTGSVPTRSQIDVAGDAAKSVPGVTSVSNKLSVVQQ